MSKHTTILVYFNIFTLFLVLLHIPSAFSRIGGWHAYMKNNFGVVDPYELPESKFDDLEDIKDCDNCPRVYFPVCAYDGITYVNLCIMQCLNQTVRRYGPCIIYRRSDRILLDVAIPSEWRINNTSGNSTEESFSETTYYTKNQISKPSTHLPVLK